MRESKINNIEEDLRDARRAHNYLFAIAGISVIFLIWCVLNINIRPEDKPLLSILALLLLLSEISAVKLPNFGFASVSLCIYMAVIIVSGPGLAGLMAAGAALLRDIARKQWGFWEILADVGISVQTICISGLAYMILSGEAAPVSTRGIIAALSALVIYGVVDYLIASTAMGMLSKDVQKTWMQLKERARWLNIGFGPMALFILPVGRINESYILILAVPLVVLRLAMQYSIEQKKAMAQEDLNRLLSIAEHEAESLKKENVALGKALQRKVDELSIFFEVGQSLGTTAGLEDTLEVILNMLRRLVVFQSCVIFLIEGKKLVPARSLTPHIESLKYSTMLKLEENIVRRTIEKGYPMMVSDMNETSDGKRIFEGERSVMCVPLIVQNETLGAIYAGAPRPDYFSQEHLQLLSMLANAGAIAIRASQLYEVQHNVLKRQQKMNEELDFRVRQLEGLMKLGQELAVSLSIEETLNSIMDNTLLMFPASTVALFYYDAGSPLMEPWKVRGPYSDVLANLSPLAKEGLLGWVVREKKALLIEDTGETKLANLLDYEKSVMVAPLMVENEVFAVFYTGADRPGTFKERHYDLFRTLAYQAALAIRNADLFERISDMATTDGLTGLYTHRHFHDSLADELEDARKHGRAVSLLMIDTDYFKQYNDRLGHPSGDIALREIARILRGFEKENDLACRYGGDEFVILLHGTGKKNAVEIGESIRREIEKHFEGHDVKLTASIGIAAFPDDGANKSQLLNAADAALYRAKEGGRNMVWTA
ncbi:MAG: diguanylate cyclase [Chloroflexi bacterium]|nr:diguanylate cyclase [Chloroflexota bacterium]